MPLSVPVARSSIDKLNAVQRNIAFFKKNCQRVDFQKWVKRNRINNGFLLFFPLCLSPKCKYCDGNWIIVVILAPVKRVALTARFLKAHQLVESLKKEISCYFSTLSLYVYRLQFGHWNFRRVLRFCAVRWDSLQNSSQPSHRLTVALGIYCRFFTVSHLSGVCDLHLTSLYLFL